MSFDEDASRYFVVLHQIEADFELDHDILLAMSRSELDRQIEAWFINRSVQTGVLRSPTQSFKEGLFDWKEVEKRLEEE